jgi:Uma2 family endonuclease
MGKAITDINELDLNGTYTVADYEAWQFDELVQLIKGKIVKMSPAPRDIHARISGDIYFELKSQARKGKFFEIRYAPYDVYLPIPNIKLGNEDTVVQPDILIVTDPKKLQAKGCVGAPDWVCEIVSKGSFKLDTEIKKELYAEAGVPDYFIVFPELEVIEVYRLNAEGRYTTPEIYEKAGQTIELSALPGLVLAMDAIFPPLAEEN